MTDPDPSPCRAASELRARSPFTELTGRDHTPHGELSRAGARAYDRLTAARRLLTIHRIRFVTSSTAAPRQFPVVGGMLRTLTLQLLLMMLLVGHCSTAPLDLEYTGASSLTDEFYRWIASRMAYERDVQVRPRQPCKSSYNQLVKFRKFLYFLKRRPAVVAFMFCL